MRVHQRKDFDFEIRKARAPISGRWMYACIISQATVYSDVRCVYHIETFYTYQMWDGKQLMNATQMRAAARRYGSAVKSGKRSVGSYRNVHLASQFGKLGLPTENQVEIR